MILLNCLQINLKVLITNIDLEDHYCVFLISNRLQMNQLQELMNNLLTPIELDQTNQYTIISNKEMFNFLN